MADPERIELALQVRLPLLNKQLRTHWAKRRKAAKNLAWQVAAALPQNRRPRTPWAKAQVLVERHSTVAPDRDNLYASAKALLDILQPLHPKVRPLGLGLIENDSDDCIDLKVVHVQSKQQLTRVIITRK